MKSAYTPELQTQLKSRKVGYELITQSGGTCNSDPLLADKQAQFEAVKRRYEYDWKRIDPRLRTSIVEGISVFLYLFDDNPAVKRTFGPPNEVYDPVANADSRFGRPLPAFAELIESGAVCCLNFPISANPGLARVIGTLLKQDFQGQF